MATIILENLENFPFYDHYSEIEYSRSLQAFNQEIKIIKNDIVISRFYHIQIKLSEATEFLKDKGPQISINLMAQQLQYISFIQNFDAYYIVCQIDDQENLDSNLKLYPQLLMKPPEVGSLKAKSKPNDPKFQKIILVVKYQSKWIFAIAYPKLKQAFIIGYQISSEEEKSSLIQLFEKLFAYQYDGKLQNVQKFKITIKNVNWNFISYKGLDSQFVIPSFIFDLTQCDQSDELQYLQNIQITEYNLDHYRKFLIWVFLMLRKTKSNLNSTPKTSEYQTSIPTLKQKENISHQEEVLSRQPTINQKNQNQQISEAGSQQENILPKQNEKNKLKSKQTLNSEVLETPPIKVLNQSLDDDQFIDRQSQRSFRSKIRKSSGIDRYKPKRKNDEFDDLESANLLKLNQKLIRQGQNIVKDQFDQYYPPGERKTTCELHGSDFMEKINTNIRDLVHEQTQLKYQIRQNNFSLKKFELELDFYKKELRQSQIQNQLLKEKEANPYNKIMNQSFSIAQKTVIPKQNVNQLMKQDTIHFAEITNEKNLQFKQYHQQFNNQKNQKQAEDQFYKHDYQTIEPEKQKHPIQFGSKYYYENIQPTKFDKNQRSNSLNYKNILQNQSIHNQSYEETQRKQKSIQDPTLDKAFKIHNTSMDASINQSTILPQNQNNQQSINPNLYLQNQHFPSNYYQQSNFNRNQYQQPPSQNQKNLFDFYQSPVVNNDGQQQHFNNPNLPNYQYNHLLDQKNLAHHHQNYKK